MNNCEILKLSKLVATMNLIVAEIDSGVLIERFERKLKMLSLFLLTYNNVKFILVLYLPITNALVVKQLDYIIIRTCPTLLKNNNIFTDILPTYTFYGH